MFDSENTWRIDDVLQESLQLGHADRRDPDNKPFETPGLNALRYVGKAADFLTSKEAFFSLKAGILVVCLALPSYIQSYVQSCIFQVRILT